MDPDYLRQLASILDDQADNLSDLEDTLRSHDAPANWSGSAADAFSASLRDRLTACASQQQDLRSAADAMRAHADAVSVALSQQQNAVPAASTAAVVPPAPAEVPR